LLRHRKAASSYSRAARATVAQHNTHDRRAARPVCLPRRSHYKGKRSDSFFSLLLAIQLDISLTSMKMTHKQREYKTHEPKVTQVMQRTYSNELDLPVKDVIGETVGTDKVRNWVLAAKDTLRGGEIFAADGTRELERRYRHELFRKE
jgi:hypothetical protein